MGRITNTLLTAFVLLSLGLALAGCHQNEGGDTPPATTAPVLTPQQQGEAGQMTQGRAADAQKSAAARKASGH